MLTRRFDSSSSLSTICCSLSSWACFFSRNVISAWRLSSLVFQYCSTDVPPNLQCRETAGKIDEGERAVKQKFKNMEIHTAKCIRFWRRCFHPGCPNSCYSGGLCICISVARKWKQTFRLCNVSDSNSSHDIHGNASVPARPRPTSCWHICLNWNNSYLLLAHLSELKQLLPRVGTYNSYLLLAHTTPTSCWHIQLLPLVGTSAWTETTPSPAVTSPFGTSDGTRRGHRNPSVSEMMDAKDINFCVRTNQKVRCRIKGQGRC